MSDALLFSDYVNNKHLAPSGVFHHKNSFRNQMNAGPGAECCRPGTDEACLGLTVMQSKYVIAVHSTVQYRGQLD